MADAYTGTGSVAWDQTAYNRLLYMAFREENVFDQVADVKSTAETNPGASVVFFLLNDLAPVTTALSEAVDVDAVALTDSTVTVNLYERGNAVIETQLLRLTSMLPTDPAIADVLGANAGESMDLFAAAALAAGTYVDYSGAATSRVTITNAHVLTSANVRFARNRLRRRKTPRVNGLYNAFVHPDGVHDLMEETGGVGWRDVVQAGTESGAQRVYQGFVGVYEGFRFIDSVNSPLWVDGGASNASAYRSIFCGKQALAKGFSRADGYGPNPITVKSPVVDKLERFQGWGWKHFVGYKLFREGSVFAWEHGSSVAD